MTAAKALNPESIYFGGVTATGGARILLAAAQAGLGDIPYVGPDGINDGTGETKDSFLNLGGGCRQELVQHARRHRRLPGQGQVRRATTRPSTASTPTGYAGHGLRLRARSSSTPSNRAGATNPADMAALREAVRVAGTDTTAKYTTILGDITFNAERRHQPEDRLDLLGRPAGANGKGDWKFETQVDYAQVADTQPRGRGSHGSPASRYPAPHTRPGT